MVLVALLFVPCMVVAITVALPILILVIAVISMPILLCYQRCSIQADHTSISDTTSAVVASQNVSTVSSPSDTIRNDEESSRSSSSSEIDLSPIFAQKKKVTFQMNNDLGEPRVVLRERYQNQPYRTISTTQPSLKAIYTISDSVLHHRSTGTGTHRQHYNDMRYRSTLHLRPEIYHPPSHSVCVG
jgi:hypothetical protein